MRVLAGILKDSLRYYQRLERQLLRRVAKLPRGSVKRRRLKGRVYYYVQERRGAKVVHQYVGRQRPEAFVKAIHERRTLKRELAKVRAALQLIPQRKLRRG